MKGYHVEAQIGHVPDGGLHGIGTTIVPGALFQQEDRAKEYLEEAVIEWLIARPERRERQ